jgi:hypothetical protein
MKAKKIKDEVYNRDITLVYDCNQEEFYQFIEKKHKGLELTRWFTYAEHISISNEKTWIRHYLWTKKGKGISCCGVMIHEVFHVTRDCFNEIGMDINEETNEAFAYYQEYIFKQILKILLVDEEETEIENKD